MNSSVGKTALASEATSQDLLRHSICYTFAIISIFSQALTDTDGDFPSGHEVATSAIVRVSRQTTATAINLNSQPQPARINLSLARNAGHNALNTLIKFDGDGPNTARREIRTSKNKIRLRTT